MKKLITALLTCIMIFALSGCSEYKAVLVITDMNDMSVFAVRDDEPYYEGEIPAPAYKNGYLEVEKIEFAKVYADEKADEELVFLSASCRGSWFLQYVKVPRGVKELWVIPATTEGEVQPPLQKITVE